MWTLLLSFVLAQDVPSPVRLCANAAEGAEVDVCLSLAAEHPDHVDGITAALRAHIDRAESGDRAFMRALLGLSMSDDAVGAAEQLAAIGDSRAVGPLMVAANTREESVMIAAVEALGAFPEAHEMLATWLLDANRDNGLRLACLDVLARRGEDVGGDALSAVIRRRGTRRGLRDTAFAALEQHQPKRYSALERPVARDGTPYLVAGGALAVGQVMGASGHAMQVQIAGTGTATGLVAGSAGGWVFGRVRPTEARTAAFITSSGAVGVTSGALIGVAFSDDVEDGGWIGSTVGNVIGFGLGAAFRHHPTRSTGDVWEANLFAGSLAVAGATGTNFARKGRWQERVQPDDSGVRWASLGAGIGLGLGAVFGHGIAPHIRLAKEDLYFMTLTGAYGLGIGLAAPIPGLRRGLPVAGLTAGVLVGYAVSGFANPQPDSVVGATTGALYGGAVAAGLGFLVDRDASSGGGIPRGFALVGSGIGLVAGSAIASGNPEFLDPADLVFVSLVTGVSALHAGALWSALAPPFRTRGWFIVAPAAIGALAAITTPLVDIPTEYSFTATSIGGWSGLFAYGGVAALDGLRRDRFLWTMAAADTGIVVGLLVGAPPVNLPPMVVALADAGGIIGGGVTALGMSLVVDGADPNRGDRIAVAGIAGAAVGITAGATIGFVVRATGERRDIAIRLPDVRLPGVRIAGQWAAMPTALSGDEGVVPGVVITGVGF